MPFRINIKGQVNSIKLPKSKALWPLFETIVNSIQSLEESINKNDGKICILAKRIEDRQVDMNGNEELTPFEEFVVTDNGNGFNDDNYSSFLEAYSNLKVAKGCKGIGRFLWLKAFREVNVDSTYKSENGWCNRKFNFNLNEGIEPEENVVPTDKTTYETSVTLKEFIHEYRDEVPLSLGVLAKKIIEHCLPFFLNDSCPQILLKCSEGETIDLNALFIRNIRDSLHQDNIIIGGKEFRLFHIQMNDGADKNELHLCANSREVKSFDLSKEIPDLQKRIIAEDGSFYYVGYLTGDYLDASVDSFRTSFDFEDESSYIGNINAHELIMAVYERIKIYLADDLEKIANEKKKQINYFVETKKPQYRYVLKQNPEIYNQIPAGLSDEKLELELFKQMQKWDMDVAKKGEEIDKKSKDAAIDMAEYMTLFKEYCSAITEISKTSLTEYVIRRKVIIKLLEKSLEMNAEGKYDLESSIHSIICPMQITSDDIKFEEMNLWLIDDRLAYHRFLASDRQMKSLPILKSNISKRMDITIFNQAISLSEEKSDINSISIIELKKPQRNDLTDDDKNPITQVLNYVTNIKSGKVKKANGRGFGDVNNAAFYCYIIADLTDSLNQDAENAGLIRTPDREGFFGWNAPKGAYIEVISYDKLVKDAKKRNGILFDKLFKPETGVRTKTWTP